MVSGTELVGRRASLGLSIKNIFLCSLDISFLFLFYPEWSALDLNGTGVFFRLVVSEILYNRSKNGSLDVENGLGKVRAPKRGL